MKVSKHRALEADATFIKTVSDWLYSFTNYIETRAEEKDSMAKLKTFVRSQRADPRVSNNLINATLNFIITKFEDRLPKLSHRHFLRAVSGNVADNCFSESSNSSLTRDPLGPNPCHHLHNSMGAINEHNQEAVAKLRHSAFDEFRATKMETESESAEQAAARVNSEDIIEPVNDLIMGEYYRSQKETCCCLEVLVKDGNFVPLNQDNMDCKVGGEQVRHFLVRTYDLNMGGTLLSVNGLESLILSDQTCS